MSFVDRNAITSAVCQDTWLLCHANANKGLNPTTAIRARGPSCEFVSFVDRNAIASAVCQDTWLLCHANANKGLNPTTAIRARGPAATGHLAIYEHRLPILPMSPNHADRTAALPAQPCRSLYPSTVRISQRTAFCVRLRSSQIV